MKIRSPFKESQYVKVEDKNRFYFMLQQMQSNRWKITSIVLFLFFFIVFGINMAVMFEVQIAENWKEMLLILLGAFVGNLNKVVDYWFNSEDRDKMLIQKVDEEDGGTLSSVLDYQSLKKPENTIVAEVASIPVVQTPTPIVSVPEPIVEEVIDTPTEDYYSSEPSDMDTPSDEDSEEESNS